MTRNPLTTFDLLPEFIAWLIAYGLSLGTDMVITVDADYEYVVRRE